MLLFSSAILIFFTHPEGEIVEVEKMLRLAEQCLERAKSSFIGRRDEPATPISYTTPINLAALSLTTALAVSPGKIGKYI
jgi:hypothetical protein